MNFAVNLNDGAMTGIFLDQRDVEKRFAIIMLMAKCLNTFSYTGAFSVAAMLGGGEQRVSIWHNGEAKTIEQLCKRY